mgnify:CR=1 FL=1
MGNETSCCSNGKSRRQNRLQNRLVAQQKAAASAASKSGESEDAMQILLKKKMREISNPSSNRHRNRSSSPALRGGKDKKEINGCECGKICMCAYLERVQKRSASRKGWNFYFFPTSYTSITFSSRSNSYSNTCVHLRNLIPYVFQWDTLPAFCRFC